MYQWVHQKFTVPGLLARHNFLHGTNTSGVKIRPALKKFMIFIS